MKITMESENEFDVDEPDVVQNNAAEEEWTPEAGGRRKSLRLRGSRSQTSFVDVGSSGEDDTDEDSDFEEPRRKMRRRGRQKKGRVSSTTNNGEEDDKVSSPQKRIVVVQQSTPASDTEPTSTTTVTSSSITSSVVTREYSSGAFVVLKTDYNNPGDPPIWKIDGKALLQKYIPFQQDGKVFYKNTSVYSGWTVSNKDQYYPCNVTFKQQNKKEHIVEFVKDSVKTDEQQSD